MCLAIGGLSIFWIAASGLVAQGGATGAVTFPKEATTLEGLPQIRIETDASIGQVGAMGLSRRRHSASSRTCHRRNLAGMCGFGG